MGRQAKPLGNAVRSIVRHALNSRPVVGCQPMMRSVVCRARRMTWQDSRIISRMKRRNSMANYFRRSALRCIIIANQLLRFHASTAITMSAQSGENCGLEACAAEIDLLRKR